MRTNHSNTIILAVSLGLLMFFIVNRLYDVLDRYAHSDAMRKHKLYLRLFKIPISLILIAVVSWYLMPGDASTYLVTLVATLLGVGISVFAVEGLRKLLEHRRVKKTLGMLKKITAPYLDSHAESIEMTLGKYPANLTVAQAQILLDLVEDFGIISSAFDKAWLDLVHSQDFMDALDDDNLYNRVADVELEVYSFTKCLTTQSIRAKYLIANFQLLDYNQHVSPSTYNQHTVSSGKAHLVT